ncbi:MAG: ABC transporter substrate-binding protein [Pseudomonadota bacterium]
MKHLTKALATTALVSASAATAAELEVVHWWTSGGEAAAVAEFAKAFDATGNTWVDGAIAGGGGSNALPAVVSRLLGGDPMGATQFNHGRQTEDLIQEGLFLDLTDLAEEQGWRDFVFPSSLLDACTYDGRLYCVPVNIHSWQWIWLNNDAFEKAGTDVPSNWGEFVGAAPALREAGVAPLAVGAQSWQSNGLINQVLAVAIAGTDVWRQVNIDKNAEVAAGPEYAKVFEAGVVARDLAKDIEVTDWNLATAAVITGQAAAQIMGDWAQGEFAVAEAVAGEDYTCLPGLGANEVLGLGGDAFYFPKNSDADVEAAQLELASLMISKEVQVNFNLKKGSLPVRGDVDLSAANDCMNKGLEILANGEILPGEDMALSQDTIGQIEDLTVQFWNSDMSASEMQERFARLIANAD